MTAADAIAYLASELQRAAVHLPVPSEPASPLGQVHHVVGETLGRLTALHYHASVLGHRPLGG